MPLYHDEDASPTLLQDKAIAVIGYGDLGRAQALNLRDSGLHVIIGSRPDSSSARAKADRFAVHPIASAVSLADVVLLLVADEALPEVYVTDVAPRLRQKTVLAFASGSPVTSRAIAPPATVDVVLVAPCMTAEAVRARFVEGSGAPALFAVAQDYSGQARAYALALARGIGATRAGVEETTFAQQSLIGHVAESSQCPVSGDELAPAPAGPGGSSATAPHSMPSPPDVRTPAQRRRLLAKLRVLLRRVANRDYEAPARDEL